MTREEEIEKALNFYAPSYWDDISCVMSDRELTASYCGFRKGVKWADKNPRSPWISVKDDLPCNHKELLDIGSGETETLMVFVASEKEFPTQTWMELRNGHWEWHGCVTPSHWMIIPELPKE